jgi:AcrR family transcriptional regulator
VQVRRTGSRKLFDKARKEVFLEWFAATCNASLSAAKAGVCYQTVFKHFAKDAAFFEAAQRALQLGYFRLEARELQEAHRPPLPAHPLGADESPSPSRGEGQYEVRVLDEAAAEEHFDAELALHLLREHRRHLPGSGDGRKNLRTTARSATNKEIAEALAKRLKGFALRVSGEESPLPNPSPAKGRGA